MSRCGRTLCCRGEESLTCDAIALVSVKTKRTPMMTAKSSLPDAGTMDAGGKNSDDGECHGGGLPVCVQ